MTRLMAKDQAYVINPVDHIFKREQEGPVPSTYRSAEHGRWPAGAGVMHKLYIITDQSQEEEGC